VFSFIFVEIADPVQLSDTVRVLWVTNWLEPYNGFPYKSIIIWPSNSYERLFRTSV